MKTKHKIVALGMSLLVLCGTIVTASASYVVNGSSYNTVTHKDIPGWGGAHYDTHYGSKKVANRQVATFIKTKGDAALGNYGGLITSSKSVVSGVVGLPLNKENIADEHGCSVGTTYFTIVTSASIEPSNTCDVTMKFSADDLSTD